MNITLTTDTYIGIGDASILLGVSRQTVYDWLAAKRYPLTVNIIGKRVLLRRDEVEALGAARRA